MPEPFTIRRGFAQWWRETLQLRGVFGAIGSLLAHGWELLRDLTPARRRLRFGDLEYDWEHGVNTTWASPAFGTRVREIFAGRGYMPTEPELFRELMAGLAESSDSGGVPIDYAQFTFIDLGCGKGRALLLATEFPFRRIVGVELLPELHTIAAENVRRFQDGAERQRIELWCGDARQFQFPPEPLVVFLFDPFPEHILAQVLANLEQSVRRQPRQVVLVYQNPISEHVLSGARWLRRLRGDVRAASYESTL